jgi:hypothetical protein
MEGLKRGNDGQSWEEEEMPWLGQKGSSSGEDLDSDYRAYTPQLMDTQDMQALRTALARSEMQIQEQGHLKEYVPRKPASSKLRRWHGLPRSHGTVNRPALSAGPASRQDHPDLIHARPSTAARPMTARIKTAEFARILKKETRQVRGNAAGRVLCLVAMGRMTNAICCVELERRYEDTKRSLLEVSKCCVPYGN